MCIYDVDALLNAASAHPGRGDGASGTLGGQPPGNGTGRVPPETAERHAAKRRRAVRGEGRGNAGEPV